MASGKSKNRHSVAIICFIPDFGHLQPLLKIADALHEAGFAVKCYISEECAPLMRRFPFEFATLKVNSLIKQRKELKRVFSRSIFFNSVCLYVHYLLLYPVVSGSVGAGAETLKRELFEQHPDVIISDALWFVDWYARIAQALGVPLIVNSFDGSLAYNQRDFVKTYGFSTISPIIQRAVEIVSLISRKVCGVFSRAYYLRTWIRLRAARGTARSNFEAAFPIYPGETRREIEWIVLGTAAIERERLGSLVKQIGANRREFAPLRFRAQLPIPERLRGWIEHDPHRPIIYVSFGSAVELDERFAAAVYRGLEAVPARVIWSLPESQQILLSRVSKADNIWLEFDSSLRPKYSTFRWYDVLSPKPGPTAYRKPYLEAHRCSAYLSSSIRPITAQLLSILA